jgi:protease-4
MFSPNAPFSREEWDWLQQTLDTTYADFTGKVAAGRGLTREAVLGVAKGQIWSGADAQEVGLVDALGGYRKALSLAKEAAGIAEETAVRLRPFPEPRDPFKALLEDALGGEIESPAALSMIRSFARLAQALAPLAEAAETLSADPRSHSLQAPAPVLAD